MARYIAQSTCCVALIAVFYPGISRGEQTLPASGDTAPVSEVAPTAQDKTDPAKEKPTLFRHSSYPAAWKAAQKTNRPILVYVCMPNCPHCTKMVEQTYELPHVGQLVSGSFETIHASRFTHANLVKKLKIKWYPTTVLVGPNNKVLDMIEGYVDAKSFRKRLQGGLASVPSKPRLANLGQ
ncbi:MAG: thioredoxin family protein [Pirellulales bacterium]|nr:thioredoxin family protein [Pirellulales bacterium]